MDGREKIFRGATAARLKFLIAAFCLAAAACFAIFLLLAFLVQNAAGRVAATAFFLAFAALSGEGIFFLKIWLSIRREADRYAFATTESACFESFGPFLGLNVRFFDGEKMREGRSRFLFGIRDVEAWQGIPLEIAYLPFPEGKRTEKGRKGKREKPDPCGSASVVIIGGAPWAKAPAGPEKLKK